MSREQKIEEIARLSHKTDKMPILIELAGTPNSGKTSIINEVDKLFRRNKIRCKVICESAKYCKIIDKKSPRYNYWTALETIQKIMEVVDQKYKIIICDRGIFDAITWMRFYLNSETITRKDYLSTIEFYLLDEWKKYVHCVKVITCEPQISMARDTDYSEIRTHGSIVNPEVLPRINEAIDETVKEFQNQFDVKCFDTSEEIREVKEKVINHIVDSVCHYLQES